MVDQSIIEKIMRQVNKMPPLPQIAHKTLALLRNPDSNMAEIANMISLDQVISSNVIGWANSAFYSSARKITTIHQAIMYLGQITVRSIVLTACVSSYLSRSLPGYGLDKGDLWKHSIGVAIGARILAAKTSKAASEDAYFAGLLCDIGKLGMEIALREIDLNTPEWQGRSFEQIESTVLGMNHAELGSLIAQKWMLPESICQTIRFHHEPSKAGKNEKLITSAVHVADLAVMMLGIGIGGDGLRYAADPESLTVLNFSGDDMPVLMDKISTDLESVASEFGLEND